VTLKGQVVTPICLKLNISKKVGGNTVSYPSVSCRLLRDKFHPEIQTGSPERVCYKQRFGGGKQAILSSMHQYLNKKPSCR